MKHALRAGAVIGVLAVIAAAGVALAFWRIHSTTAIPAAEELQIPDPTVVLDQDGELIQTLEPAAVRANVALDDLPDHVPAAILAAEDRGFYEHQGFSTRGILRALWVNLTEGERQQGASTITQQYVAMAVADIDDSYTGKFREVAVATRLERELSKDDILEMYLNAVPFGRTAYGIEAAAQTYFAVPASELDVEQAAVLAGMIAAPTAYDPADNPDGAAARRDFVLDGMVQTGAVPEEKADELIGSELPELRTEPLFEFGPHAYFLDAVRDAVPTLLGEDQDLGAGLVIHTTMDRRGQDLAHETLNDQLDGTEHTGAVVTVEAETGAVRTLLGGRDYEQQQFNVALHGERSIGSAFKTFTLAELVAQGYDPDQTRIDAPEELVVEQDGSQDDATIGNYSGHGHGEVDLRQATVESINTAYVRIAEELGYEAVAERAEDLGIDQDLPAFPSLTLGSIGVSPLRVAAAYATLANDGVRARPYVVERIESHDGEILYEHEPETEEVLAPEETAVVSDVLQDVVIRGTGTAAAIGRPVAGKTGTTNDNVDAWFAGYTPQHATVVWVGNEDNSPMEGVTGGSLPAISWGAYMGAYVEPFDVEEFPAPDTSGLQAWRPVEEENLPPPPEPEPEPEPEPAPEPEETEEPEPEETEEPDEPEPEETEEPDEPEETEEPEEPDPGEGDGNGNGNGDGNGDGGGNGNGNGNGGGNGNGDDDGEDANTDAAGGGDDDTEDDGEDANA
ncbi:transglycosylase domain-containing protein [Egicoccus sp. AB-alg2]|uniref:transglycosylase domain-containing protein n=1 Tax=Egicoccus sp. AB-alg2 TaxID=3242693 RepID=UPI00359CEFA7